MSTEESVGLLSNTYISFPRVSFENECVSDTYAWHVTKKAPWHMSVYGAVYVGIVQAVLNSTVSLKHKRYRHVSSWWRRNVRVRRASYKVRVRCNIVRPNTAVQRGNPWLIQGAYDIRPHGVGSSSSNALKNIEEQKNDLKNPLGKEKLCHSTGAG